MGYAYIGFERLHETYLFLYETKMNTYFFKYFKHELQRFAGRGRVWVTHPRRALMQRRNHHLHLNTEFIFLLRSLNFCH